MISNPREVLPSLLVAFFSLLALHCSGQLSLEWELKIPSDLNIYSTQSQLDHEQNLIICGHDNWDTTNIHTYKISSDGGLVWHHEYDDTAGLWDHFEILFIDHDNNIVVGGQTVEFLDFDYDVVLGQIIKSLIFKLNSEGEMLWYRKYSLVDSSTARIRSVSIDDQNNYLALSEEDIGTENTLTLLRIDPEGDLVSDTTIVRDPGYGDLFTGFYFEGNRVYASVLQIGSFAEFLYINSYDFKGQTLRSFVVDKPHYFATLVDLAAEEFYGTLTIGLYGVSKLSSSGEHLWDYVIPKNLPPNSFSDRVNAIIVKEDGIAITGKHDGIGTKGDVLTTKLNLAGDVIWQHRYQGDGKPTYESANAMIHLNNQLVIGGTRQLDSAGYSDFLLLVLHESNGKLIELEASDFNTEGDEEIRMLHKINAEDFYVFGYSHGQPSEDPALIIQKYGLATSLGRKLNLSGIKVYPQPAHKKLIVESKIPISRIRLLNQFGQILHDEKGNGIGLTIELPAVVSGVHLLEVQRGNDITLQKIMVVQ